MLTVQGERYQRWEWARSEDKEQHLSCCQLLNAISVSDLLLHSPDGVTGKSTEARGNRETALLGLQEGGLRKVMLRKVTAQLILLMLSYKHGESASLREDLYHSNLLSSINSITPPHLFRIQLLLGHAVMFFALQSLETRWLCIPLCCFASSLPSFPCLPLFLPLSWPEICPPHICGVYTLCKALW